MQQELTRHGRLGVPRAVGKRHVRARRVSRSRFWRAAPGRRITGVAPRIRSLHRRQPLASAKLGTDGGHVLIKLGDDPAAGRRSPV